MQQFYVVLLCLIICCFTLNELEFPDISLPSQVLYQRGHLLTVSLSPVFS